MDKYYYLVAQLPSLSFGREPEITIEYFFSEAEKWLSERDFRVLSRIDLHGMTDEMEGPSVLKAYSRFEAKLKSDVALWRRAQRRDQDYKPESIPVAMLKEGDPLEVETRLLQWRWDFIDELEREHHFDFGKVILYYLKLRILERLFTFNKETGLEKFKTLYEVNV